MPRLIDADALYDIVMDSIKPMTKNEAIILQDFIALVEDAPTVDAEPIRHGHWVDEKDQPIYCSCCGFGKKYESKRSYAYCPKCGVKLDEVEEDAKIHNQY